MFKRCFVLLTVFLLVVGLAGCGQPADDSSSLPDESNIDATSEDMTGTAETSKDSESAASETSNTDVTSTQSKESITTTTSNKTNVSESVTSMKETTSQTSSTTQLKTYTKRVVSPPSTSTEYVGPDKLNLKELADRALVTTGNSDRLLRLFERARSGEDIVVGFIGGSITYGAGSSSMMYSYAEKVTQWFKDTFKASDIKMVNAGISATNSFYGVHRAWRDLLQYKPDFVIVEFAVNDQKTPMLENTYEMLVRNILNSSTKPAVMLLCAMTETGGNVQEWHEKVALHYGLPLVSYRDALWPEVSYGRIKFTDITKDDMIHPNDNGHKCMAYFVTDALTRIYKQTLPLEKSAYTVPNTTCYEKEYGEKPVPFKNARMITTGDIKVTNKKNAKIVDIGFGEKAYEISNGGSITIDISGYSAVAFRHLFVNRDDMGYGMVEVDGGTVEMFGGGKTKVFDAYFPATGAATANNELLVTHLDTSGQHSLTVSHVDMSGFGHDGVTGEHFYVIDLMVSE